MCSANARPARPASPAEADNARSTRATSPVEVSDTAPARLASPVEADNARPARPTYRGEAGNATVRALAVIVALTMVASLSISAVRVLGERERMQAALDMAVLAGASEMISAIGSAASPQPCAAAAKVAGMNGIELATCEVRGFDVVASATAKAPVFSLKIEVRARAGPRDSEILEAITEGL
ncbi:MAG: flp pilus-assembly TadE/G-like family protein [Actinomycetaceae bacterium]|nr:flp pilus-assembly TadE/G-like family protein [Actinomycetaceae bacterium]